MSEGAKLYILVHFAAKKDQDSFARRVARVVPAGSIVAVEKYAITHPFDAKRDEWWLPLWRGMPEYANVPRLLPFASQKYVMRDEQGMQALRRALGLQTRARTAWYPQRAPRVLAHKTWVTRTPIPPRYPIYIISKGRWERPLTARWLDRMGVQYRLVIEPQEADKYAAAVGRDKLLLLPFSNLGQGSIPARNWVWKHSLAEGHKRHWILDDNLPAFHRRHRNEILKCLSGNIFRAAEDWVDRWANVGLAGFNYQQFVVDIKQHPPLILNTRVYSCILVNNSVRHRWRGKYNEDTDLSLRILKDGMCTVLFNAFLVTKMPTMTMKGGNTDEVYERGQKRKEFAESLHKQHPDVARVAQRYGRWHHMVNYTPFKGNKLVPAPGKRAVPPGVNEYGMRLKIGRPKKS